MTSPELHPDDLLDKEARGTLSADEHTSLEKHMAACAVCRFERLARVDFRLEFERLGWHGWEDHPAANPSSRARFRGAQAKSSPFDARVAALLVAATMFLAGIATAGWSFQARHNRFVEAVTSASPPPAVLARGARLADQELAPSLENTIVTAASSVPSASLRPKKRPLPEAKATPSSSNDATHFSDSEPPPITNTPTAASLFADATGAREHGAYDEAVRLYRELATRYADSPEAAAAHAIAGRILLDRGRAETALQEFDAYLASGMTTLEEDAFVGRAMALERLDRPADELVAWQNLLQRYPHSVHASRAHARFGQLVAR